MQAAILAAVLTLAADSQALPRAELDAAIQANKDAKVAELNGELAIARKALRDANKGIDRREKLAAARAKIKELETELAAVKKAGTALPHLGIDKLSIGQVGRLYAEGRMLGPFKVRADGSIEGKDGAWYDLPIVATVEKILDATSVLVAYKGRWLKIRMDTADLALQEALREDDSPQQTIRLDVPLKVVGTHKRSDSDPHWLQNEANWVQVFEIRFFAK